MKYNLGDKVDYFVSAGLISLLTRTMHYYHGYIKAIRGDFYLIKRADSSCVDICKENKILGKLALVKTATTSNNNSKTTNKKK